VVNLLSNPKLQLLTYQIVPNASAAGEPAQGKPTFLAASQKITRG
jgi:hypothetical protein